MLTEKIKELVKSLDEKRSAYQKDLTTAADLAKEDKLSESRELTKKLEPAKAEINTLESDLQELRDLQKELEEQAKKTPEERKLAGDKSKVKVEIREAFNEFLRSKGEKRDGLTSIGAEAIIPTDQVFTPQLEPQDTVDLSSLVNKVSVSTPSGKYPVLKNATETLVTVEELVKNPELGKPQFINVPWNVSTYRGQLPISQESIDDAAVDLTAIVANYMQQVKLNTTNKAVSAKLKTFTAKSAVNTDDIKHILNVDLLQAYNRVIIASSSAYNWLDTLKDKNGQYILHQDITSASGYVLFGHPIYPVDDALIGAKAGDMVMFIGDPKAGVLLPDRVDFTARWIENEIYGQVLSLGTRFDVEVADASAGFYVTLAPVTTATAGN